MFRVIGREELIETDGFVTRRDRWANHEEVDRIVEGWTRERSKRDVFDAMIAEDVPCGMVMDIEEVLNDEDLNERGVFADVDQPGLGPMRLPRSPIVFDDKRPTREPSRLLGEDNVALYEELFGYGEAQLAELIQERVITGPPKVPD